MRIQENVELAPYTTFRIGGPARYFSMCENVTDLQSALAFAKGKKVPVLVLGGGSNMLVADKGFEGLVLHPMLLGLAVITEDSESVTLQIGAGEYWDKVVEYAVAHNWWGIENLSHVPGNSGALVIQNVGAYGQEASEVVVSVEALDMQDAEIQTFLNKECDFTYRHSIFNTTHKNKYIVLSVLLKLKKQGVANLSYGDMKERFQKNQPTIEEVRQAIIEIRNKKYPFPNQAVNGNAGSFFRGPIVSKVQMDALEAVLSQKFGPEAAKRLKSMQDKLRVSQGFKTPTAFLIDLCGLKGFQVGGAKVNETQPAIVLNATGEATAKDVLQLSEHVRKVVRETFGVDLEVEPELVGF